MLRLSLFLVASGTLVLAADPKPLPESSPVEIDCEVLSPEGRPVAGAEVLLTLRPNFNQEAEKEQVLAAGQSGADGHWRVTLAGQPKGVARFGTFIVRKQGIGVGGFSQVLAAEEPGLPAGPLRLTAQLVPVAECRVQLRRPDGRPAAGVHVWVDQCTMPRDPRGFMYTSSYLVPRLAEIGWEATTDADGRCVIPGLPREAHLYLRHDAAGLAQLPGRYRMHFPEAPRALDRESTHTLVTSGAVQGRVALPDGTPVRGSSLALLEATPYITAYGDQVHTDEEGRFEFLRVPPSKYKIRYRSPGRDEDLWVGDEDVPVTVEAGQTAATGDLKLTPAAVVTGRVVDAESGVEIEKPIIFRLKEGSHQLCYRMHRMGPETHLQPDSGYAIPVQVKAGERKEVAFRLAPRKPENLVSGTVLDMEGRPVAKASVGLLGVPHEFDTPQQTDEKGAFRIAVTNPKSTPMLLAWTDGAISEPTAGRPGGSVEMRLQGSGLTSIRGTIRDEQGKPVPGASFHAYYGEVISGLLNGPPLRFVLAADDGTFVIPRLPKAVKRVSLSATADGYGRTELREQELKEGQMLEWYAVLRTSGASAEGVVVDGAGAPVGGVRLRIDGGGQPRHHPPVFTDNQGRFKIEKLSRGALVITAEQQTAEFARSTFIRVVAPARDLRLVLPDATGAASGVVLDHAGKPVPGAEVNAFARGRKVTADADGRFSLTGLEAGWFTVWVDMLTADGQRIHQDFRLRTGMKEARLDMPAQEEEREETLPPPVDLTGKEAPEIHVGTWLHTEPLAAKAGGKVRILDFWGTECGPCLSGFPKVQKFWEKHWKDGIEVIALSADFYPEQEVVEYRQKHPELKFPMAISTKDARDAAAYQVRGIPTYVVIGKDGKILSSSHDWDEATAVALKANAVPLKANTVP